MSEELALDVTELDLSEVVGGGRILERASLRVSDVTALVVEGPQHSGGMYNLEHMRYSHHGVARMLAAGLRPLEVCRKTGYSPSTISVLQEAPAFKDLISHYQKDADKAAFDLAESIHLAAGEGITSLLETLRSGADLNPAWVHKVTMDLVDRDPFTAKPTRVMEHRHLHATAEDLRKAKKEAQQKEAGYRQLTAEISPEPVLELEVVDESDC